MTIILFLGVLFALILVHEFGHFAVAKKVGMLVEEFGIGFPPKLFGFRKGETEYTLNLFPVGGFVRILGENGDVHTSTKNPRAFTAKSALAQAAVLVAGVTMNVLFAWAVFVIVPMIGVMTPIADDVVSSTAQLTVTEVVSDSPAAEARIPLGATIVSLSRGEQVLEVFTPQGFATFSALYPKEPLQLTYRENGLPKTVTLASREGVINDEPLRPALGIALARIDTVRSSFKDSLIEGTKTTALALKGITLGVTTLLFDAIRFRADLTSVAGPIGIAGFTADAAAFGIVSLLTFAAFISLNLAVINMLPFPALDGGRLLMVCIEAIFGKPIPTRVTTWLNTAGFFLLILLMVAVTYHDILRLW